MKSFRYQVKRLSNKLGFDLYPFDNRNSIQNYLSFLFARYDIRDLIDIGANKGQYHNMIRNMGYKGSVYLIEPLEKEWNFLKKNIVNKIIYRFVQILNILKVCYKMSIIYLKTLSLLLR